MYQPPPFRGRSVFDDKKVLLIDPHQRARDVRASVLRSRGIEVDATDSLQAARDSTPQDREYTSSIRPVSRRVTPRRSAVLQQGITTAAGSLAARWHAPGRSRRIASAGDVLCFPSGIKHGATMLDEEVVLVDIFTPIREEFLRP